MIVKKIFFNERAAELMGGRAVGCTYNPAGQSCICFFLLLFDSSLCAFAFIHVISLPFMSVTRILLYMII